MIEAFLFYEGSYYTIAHHSPIAFGELFMAYWENFTLFQNVLGYTSCHIGLEKKGGIKLALDFWRFET